MTGPIGKQYSNPRNRPGFVSKRRPFWLPASNYYSITVVIGLSLFLLTWGILHDGGDETPWITAGIGFGILMIGAVILRELVLRRARNRYLALERQFDRHLSSAVSRIGSDEGRPEKLTIEKNEKIVADIRLKSDAAKVLNKFADAHREVFELCHQYLLVNERELRRVGSGSPRIRALRKGRSSVSRYHRFHLLAWAQIETRNLTHEVAGLVDSSEKASVLQNALAVIDSALEYYPDELSLIESREVLTEMLASIRVTHFVEKAERSEFDGDHKTALNLYRDALFYLGRDNIKSAKRDAAAQRITFEIERLRQIESESI
ncbi:MAG: hypothetical protein IPG67_00560 [Acidobacteria bacterium]|nr:hypothetical protein [Acidobacteriota bacterium]